MARKRYKLSCMIAGKRRYTLLYRRWKDIRNRTQGRGTKRPDLYEGIELGWGTFKEFRKWALANGFNKYTSSPDRQDSTQGYVPGNVVFETPAYNRDRALQGGADDWRGDEPPHHDFCDCDACIPIPGLAA